MLPILSYKLLGQNKVVLGQNKVVLPKGLYKAVIGTTVDYFSIKY